MFAYFIGAAFGLYFFSGIAFGYIASYELLNTVAYLSPWLPIWTWIADIGLYVHAVSLCASSAVGFIGSIAKRLYAIKLCFYILITLFLVEIGVTVQLATRSDSLIQAISTDLYKSMDVSQRYYSRNSSDTAMWDEIQIENNCCGIYNYTDWFSTKFGREGDVPDSCCLLISKDCGHAIVHNEHPDDVIITEGCLPQLIHSMVHDYHNLGRKIWLTIMILQFILLGIMTYILQKLKSLTVKGYPFTLSNTSLQGSKYNLIQDASIE